MTGPADREDSTDPTKLYDPNDPRYYGYSRFQFRLWHGMTTWAFLKLLKGNLHHISPQRYGLVLSVLLLTSPTHSILALLVKIFYRKRIKETQFHGDPICILGFMRSGTTFLNELLACDDRFVSPDNMQCIMPESFLIAEKRLRNNPIAKLEKRPMDDMDMSMDAPQEDEIAMLTMGQPSPYKQMAFPSVKEMYHDSLATQRDPKVRRKWIDAWVWFLRKVQLRSPDKQLLLKSPTHTVRVSLIREIFPDSKFIHITRNPYRIFQSNLKLGKALSVTQGFEARGMTDEQLMHDLKDGFPSFHEAFEKQKAELPEGALVTVSYEDLVRDPLGVMRKIYTTLGLPDIDHALPAMQAYIDSRKGYKPNTYKEDPEVVKMINDNWDIYFDTYGYDKLPVEGSEPPVTDTTVAPEEEAPGAADDSGTDNKQVPNASHG